MAGSVGLWSQRAGRRGRQAVEIGDRISELALGRYDAVQTMAFVAAGISTASLAFAVRALTAASRWSATGCLLLAINAAALILAAIFPPIESAGGVDPSSLSSGGVFHLSAVPAGFISVVASMLVFTRAFAEQPDHHGRGSCLAAWRRRLPWRSSWGIGRRLDVQILRYGKFHPAWSSGGPGNRRAR